MEFNTCAKILRASGFPKIASIEKLINKRLEFEYTLNEELRQTTGTIITIDYEHNLIRMVLVDKSKKFKNRLGIAYNYSLCCFVSESETTGKKYFTWCLLIKDGGIKESEVKFKLVA